ncbi:MAG: hypothetical protein ACI9HK_002749 [Pirellulaceae bacterium]|jgi:hypothetical protein
MTSMPMCGATIPPSWWKSLLRIPESERFDVNANDVPVFISVKSGRATHIVFSRVGGDELFFVYNFYFIYD